MSSGVKSLEPILPKPISGFEDFGHIELKGISNCRDLGGLPCKDGKRIKSGRLMRSAELHDAADSDMDTLVKNHGLKRIVDLRTGFEIGREEDPFPKLQDIGYINLRPIASEHELAGGEKDLKATFSKLAEDTSGVFLEMYREMVEDEHSRKVYSEFLHMLLDAEEGATLWHCTQGKDRTGLAAVYVERALGASMQDIRADYLATNLFARGQHEKLVALFSKIPGIDQLEIDIEALSYAQISYLDTALDAINGAFGSLDDYIAEALDFGVEEQSRLQDLYLC